MSERIWRCIIQIFRKSVVVSEPVQTVFCYQVVTTFIHVYWGLSSTFVATLNPNSYQFITVIDCSIIYPNQLINIIERVRFLTTEKKNPWQRKIMKSMLIAIVTYTCIVLRRIIVTWVADYDRFFGFSL